MILKDPFQISWKCIYMCDTNSVSNSGFVRVWVEEGYGRRSPIFPITSSFLFQIQLPSTIKLCDFDFQSTSNNMKSIAVIFKLAYLTRGYYLMFPEAHFG